MKDEIMTVYDVFNGECPDCGEDIPKDAEEGSECENCGHIFWFYKPMDDTDADFR